MARSINWDRVYVFAQEEYMPVFSDQVFESSNLFKHINGATNRKKGGSHTFVISPILHAKNEATGAVKGFSALNIDPNNKFTEAIYEWATLYASITVSFDEEDAMVTDNKIMDMLTQEMKVAKMTLVDQLSTALFNDGSDDDYPHGLQKIVSTGRTLGSINSSTYSFWDANVMSDTTNYNATNLKDPTSDYYITKLLRQMWHKVKHNNEIPSVIVMTPGWENIIEDELQPYMRYQNSDVKSANVDYASFAYRGKVPFVQDDYCPDGQMYWLNDNYFNFYIHRARNFKLEPFQKPVDRLARVAQITIKCQFATNGPRSLGKIQAATSIEPS